MKRILITVGLITLLLAGCSSAPEPTSVPTVTGTATRTLIPSTPTKTLIPTWTPSPPRPTNTPNWEAYHGDYAEAVIKLSDGSAEWIFQADEPPFETVCMDWHCFPEVETWSEDGQYAYVATYVVCIDCPFEWPVIRLDRVKLEDGQVLTIFPESNGSISNETIKEFRLAFSSNGEKLLYSTNDGKNINFSLVNLETLEEQSFSQNLDFVSTIHNHGALVWTPTDKYILFSVTQGNAFSPKDFFVYRINPENMEIDLIYYLTKGFLQYPEWISNTEVRYGFFDVEDGDWKYLSLNVVTGEFLIVEEEE